MCGSYRTLQLTLAILKPDVVAHPHIVQEIRSMILKNGFYFVKSKHMHMTRARAEDFYEEHKGKFFLNRLVCFMSSGPIWTHILAREDGIQQWRQLMGPTKVLKTIYEVPDTIRGQFGLTDTRNCSHGSDSEATAKREIEFFFPEFDIDKWHKEMEEVFQSGLVEFDEECCLHVPSKSMHHKADRGPA
ncbi:nucleoside diphosphate kinase 6-like [Babylonia areolata]|uniref:nucleoside diphosphate kinase 6-like n=1 Tax=Babylonia areolata TaxID=304850 RepID=UPI003FCFBEF5